MNLPEFSVKRRITTLMFILIIMLFGIVAVLNLGLDLMPDMEFPMVTIVARYPGVAAEDIEKLITEQIEKVVSTVKNVKSVYSVSQEGLSNVMVEFSRGTNIDFAGQDVRDAIALIVDFLPDDADTPTVIKFNISNFPIIFYGVTGLKDTMELRDYLDDNIVHRIERLEGVASAMVVGGLEREINVLVDKGKLEAYGLSLPQVLAALRQENLNVSAGHITTAQTEYLIRTMGEYKEISHIRDTIITSRNGSAIYIKDIALVKDTYKEIRNLSRVDGRDSMMFAVMKQSGANTVNVSDRVNKELSQIRKEGRLGDIKFNALMDQADFIRQSVNTTTRSLLEGGILAMILIFLFLRNWRPTLTIFFSIPLSIITTFIGMYIFNYTFNLMTLGGLALGIGMLVDNSVVVIENTFRHLEEGADRITAAIKGATEVGMAITASTFTTMAVFVPMCLTKGIAGQLVRPMALTVCLSLLASLFVALTIVPMIASFIFRKEKKEEYAKEFGETGFAKFKQAYATLLGNVLENKTIVLIGAFLIFVVAISTIPLLGLEFMPTQDDPMTVLQIKLPPGAPLEATNLIGEEIEKYERSLPETRHVMASIGPFAMSARGAASGMAAADVNEGMIMSRLVDKLDRTRSSAQVMDDIRKKCPPLEGATFTFRNMHSMGTSVDQTPVAIRIFGKDIDTLRGLGNQAQELIKNVVGLRDMEISLKEGKPELRIKVDREKAAQFGLSVSQIGQTLETAVMGKVATTLRRGGDEWDIRVRLAEEDRSSIDKLKNITLFPASPFPTPLVRDGAGGSPRPAQAGQILLDEVADISYEQGPVQITRENRSRKVTITADTFGRDMGSIIADIKSRLAGLQLPSGYFIDYGGTYKDMQSTFRDLGYALIIALFLIYMIMAALFESLLEPFIVMFTQPLALIGVVFGLLLFGQTFSTPAFIGFIILLGVVVNNTIVMINYINQLRARGKELIPAVVEGAATRLRPILITAITTILGVLPMAISRGEGSEMTSPLGIALSSGLLLGTFLTLFIVPCIYLVLGRRNIPS